MLFKGTSLGVLLDKIMKPLFFLVSLLGIALPRAMGADEITENVGEGPKVSVPVANTDGKIVYSSDPNKPGSRLYAGASKIFVINSDGSHQTPLPLGMLKENFYPSFSADGKKIVFSSVPFDTSEIYLTNSDGTQPIQLTHNQSNDSDSCFSPDGEKVLFVARKAENLEIYALDSDGANLTRLTHGARDVSPCFSPDGKTIAFVTNVANYYDGGEGSGSLRGAVS